MLSHRALRRRQSGVMLLEVLIALLIFSLGVLGLVGLQASAVKQSGQAKFRADATMLANELIGQMWLSGRTFAILQIGFSSATAGAQYTAWKTRVQSALPGADTSPPTVVVQAVPALPIMIAGVPTANPAPPSTRVTITMRWKAPGEPASDPHHSFVLVNEIK